MLRAKLGFSICARKNSDCIFPMIKTTQIAAGFRSSRRIALSFKRRLVLWLPSIVVSERDNQTIDCLACLTEILVSTESNKKELLIHRPSM